MRTIVGLVSIALTVALALVIIMSIPSLRRLVGLGDVSPSGLPASITGTNS